MIFLQVLSEAGEHYLTGFPSVNAATTNIMTGQSTGQVIQLLTSIEQLLVQQNQRLEQVLSHIPAGEPTVTNPQQSLLPI